MFLAIHATITLVILFYFLFSNQKLNFIVFSFYVLGCELIWKMGKIWEGVSFFPSDIVKYILVISYILAIPIFCSKISKNKLLLFLFFLLCLLPGAVMSIVGLEYVGSISEYILFNLSGVLLLGVSYLFFSNNEIEFNHLNKLGNAYLYGIITSVFFIAINFSQSNLVLDYLSSNNQLTNEFSANQASSLLGLGSLFGFINVTWGDSKHKIVNIIIMLICLSVALLTFSRGGVLNFIVPVAVGLILMRKTIVKKKIHLAGFIIVMLVSSYFLFQFLIDFTSGSISQRYTDMDTTGRIEIIKSELEMFKEKPILGYGVGMGEEYRRGKWRIDSKDSHTEYTRLIGEHGVFGILINLIIILFFWDGFKRNKSKMTRILILVLFLWATLQMSHSATRIAASSFLVGFTAIRIEKKAEN